MRPATKPRAEYDFAAYAIGPIFASACVRTTITDEEATELMNAAHPTGISSHWRISDEDFANGPKNGCPCPDYPRTHRHLLFNC